MSSLWQKQYDEVLRSHYELLTEKQRLDRANTIMMNALLKIAEEQTFPEDCKIIAKEALEQARS